MRHLSSGVHGLLRVPSLCHHPTVIIALNRTIRDGSSYVSCLTPIPDEEWVERNWFIVNHWEDQFCRDVYQDLCIFAEFQHYVPTALISPGTTPMVCPVDTLVNTHPSQPLGDQATMDTLDPCAWRYVLTMDDLASFRLKTRSDVVGTWEIASTTYNFFYCQVKIEISAQCFTQTTSNSGKSYCGEQSDKVDKCASHAHSCLAFATRIHEAHLASVHHAEKGSHTAYWCLKGIS